MIIHASVVHLAVGTCRISMWCALLDCASQESGLWSWPRSLQDLNGVATNLAVEKTSSRVMAGFDKSRKDTKWADSISQKPFLLYIFHPSILGVKWFLGMQLSVHHFTRLQKCSDLHSHRALGQCLNVTTSWRRKRALLEVVARAKIIHIPFRSGAVIVIDG